MAAPTDARSVNQCPQCGLISDPTAANCDCGYNFATGAARALSTAEAQRVLQVGKGYRVLLFVIGLQIFVTGLQIFVSIAQPAVIHRASRTDSGAVVLITLLVLLVCPAVAGLTGYRLARAMELANPLAWVIGLFIPYLSILVFLDLSSRAIKFCRSHGLRVRLLVPSRGSIQEFAGRHLSHGRSSEDETAA